MADKLEVLKVIAENAQLHITWSLGLFGGSVAMIIGTSHLRPASLSVRRWYLLMIPAWIVLGLSVYFGDLIYRHYIAAMLAPREKLTEIFVEMNFYYGLQQDTMAAGVAFLAGWLAIYLLWWIFRAEERKE